MSGKGPSPEDREALERAMAGVRPLAGGRPAGPRPKPPRPKAAPRAETAGPPVAFLPEEADAHERWAADLGREPLRALKRGKLGVAESIDLHGLTEAEALRALEGAVAAALGRGALCLRVVHGRGRHSENGPVLRTAVRRWLAGPELGRSVAAFRQAPPEQGGSGATQVVLRRTRRNARS